MVGHRRTRVPMGYLNKRRIEGSADIRWVEVDPDRGPLITWAFEQYSTGDWSLSKLRAALNAKGFTTRTTAKTVGQPLSVNAMNRILRNVYYTGIVPFMGAYYEGDHDALVDISTRPRVQDVLHAHNRAGDKDREHAQLPQGQHLLRRVRQPPDLQPQPGQDGQGLRLLRVHRSPP